MRGTLGILIAVVLAMTLHVPGISLALALLFLMQRERPGLTIGVGFQILLGTALAAATSLFWVQLTDGTDVARFFGVVFGVFIAAFCMAATDFPLLFAIFAFYGVVDLAAWDAHRSTNAIVTTILYNLASVALVTVSTVAVEYLFGTRSPSKDLAYEMDERIALLSRFFHAMARRQGAGASLELRTIHGQLVEYAHAGALRMNELYNRLRDQNPTLSGVPIGNHYRISLLSRILEESVLIGFHREESTTHRAHYSAIAALCDSLRDHAAGPLERLPESAPARLRQIYTELQQYAASRPSTDAAPMALTKPVRVNRLSFSLFLPGAFENGDAAIYALKLTLAATICYILYNAIAWPGILTCVVTVLFTGLSTTGAMKQKQFYRFSGAAVGGVLGIATVSLLFPNMDSITSLVIVVAAVSMFAGWVMRSPRMSYVGVQIGFAYFLTILQDFRAATRFEPARDRLIGVAVGILVMWFIFDQLWPTRTSTALGQILQKIGDAAAQLRSINDQHDPAEAADALSRLRVAVSAEIASVQQLESAVYFDFGEGHRRELARSRKLIRQIESAAADFYAEALRLNRRDAVPDMQ